jgi:hypothetical protein
MAEEDQILSIDLVLFDKKEGVPDGYPLSVIA